MTLDQIAIAGSEINLKSTEGIPPNLLGLQLTLPPGTPGTTLRGSGHP